MSDWKTRKVSKTMAPYLRKELDHRKIKYKFTPGEPGTIETKLSNKRFHEVMEDALCMKQRAESGSNLPVLSLGMVMNDRRFMEKSRELAGPDGSFVFHILNKDYENYMNYVK